MNLRLYVGSNGGTFPTQDGTKREIDDFEGFRCWTAAHKNFARKVNGLDPSKFSCLLDSGAFSHSLESRLSFAQSLENQIAWESRFDQLTGETGWMVEAIASYDFLIDEMWVDGIKKKRRWSEESAEMAVDETIKAAHFLAAHREELSPRHLVLGCQGVSASQYLKCVDAILPVSNSHDWIGLGGWCILGLAQFRYWLPEFVKTLHLVIPKIAKSPVKHVHLYGVLWERAIAPFAWICDRYGLTCSVDSKKPITDCSSTDRVVRCKRGARKDYWRDNVKWWIDHCAHINHSRHYTTSWNDWEYSPLGKLGLEAIAQ